VLGSQRRLPRTGHARMCRCGARFLGGRV